MGVPAYGNIPTWTTFGAHIGHVPSVDPVGDTPMWQNHCGTHWGIAGISLVWAPYVGHRVPHWEKLVHSDCTTSPIHNQCVYCLLDPNLCLDEWAV